MKDIATQDPRQFDKEELADKEYIRQLQETNIRLQNRIADLESEVRAWNQRFVREAK